MGLFTHVATLIRRSRIGSHRSNETDPVPAPPKMRRPAARANGTMNDAFRQGFDWVMREVVMDPSDRSAFFRAAYRVRNEGHWKGTRTLAAAWPETAQWPKGSAYLADQRLKAGDDEPEDIRDLMELLHGRLLHVAHRIFRDEQVREVVDPASPSRIRRYTNIVLNRSAWEEPACGQGTDVILSITEGLKQMQEPACEHPVCRCTYDPHPISLRDDRRQ